MRFTIFIIVIILFISCDNGNANKLEIKIKYAKSALESGYPLADFFVRAEEDGIKGIHVDTSKKGLVVSFSITCNAADNIHGAFERIHHPATHNCDTIKLFYNAFPSTGSKENKKVLVNLYYRFTDVLSYRKSKFIAVDKTELIK